MPIMTTRELQWLVGDQKPPCVSIYLPTHRHHPGTEQDRIRFKNLLGRAAELLRGDFRHQDVERFLAPVAELSQAEFWRRQEDGLAVFRSTDVFAHYRLPVSVPELVVVAPSFHTRPLVGYLASNRHYFVLSLSRNAVRLYEGTPHSLDEVEIASLSAELRDVLGEAKASRFLAGAPAEGEPPVRASGEETERKKELLKYFRAIDRALWPLLRDERAPLVLAAVSYYHPLFLAASRYRGILPEGIEGNVERMSTEELRAAAWRLVSAHEQGVESDLLAQYAKALPTGRASGSLEEIARAAAHGRIRVLLHQPGKTVWGRLDRESGELVIRPRQRDSEDADILDDLCELTLLKGGEVFELSSSGALGDSPVAAIYRY